MRPDIVLGIARTEARLARRLVRFWVFAVLSLLVVTALYLYYAFLHGLFSSYSGTVGSISPKFLIAGFGIWGVVFFMVGLILLGFDVRSRDERERVAEVLDTRPYSNLELVTGRFLGLLFMSWLTMAAAILLVELIGWLGVTLGWSIGEPLEPRSMVAFVFTMSIPAFSFTLALTFLVSLVCRNRMVTALVMFALLGGWIWFLFSQVAMDLAYTVDVTGAYSLNFASEIVSVFFAQGLAQRAAVLAIALGLLGIAAAVHPRPDTGQRRIWAAGGVLLVLFGIAGIGVIRQQILGERARAEQWLAAHDARRSEIAPDLAAIRGEVNIEPGRSLELDLELDLEAPAGVTLDRALLSLNPGLVVERIADASGRELAFTYDNGLLDVELASPLAEGTTATLALEASGLIELGFGYLDSSRKLSETTLWQGNVAILGFDSAKFDPKYVALMPGVRWLPASGADVGRGDGERPADFFHLDVTVEVPQGWLVAGPGKRHEVPGAPDGRQRFRYAPEAPLPEAALMASRFERRAMEVAGVELEVLVHPKHTRNLEVMAEAKDEIRGWIEERFQEAADLGLTYPYGALTMVEIPPDVRGFGGGWRMDTVLAPPAMLLVRESSFPTARFDTRFSDPKEFEDEEGGMPRAKREALEEFFENDFNGGNVFLGAARNFFLHQTASHGPGALALDFVCHDLANRIVTEKRGYFSAHVFKSGGETNQLIAGAFTNFFNEGAESFVDAIERTLTERPEIWEQALGISLADMDPWEDPGRTVNVLVLKGGALSRSLVDGLGREKTGRLLAALRERSAGRTFSREDLAAVAAELEIDLDALVGDWLEATDLPGIVASPPRLYRLADTEDGTPRYQLALDLRNDEAAPGLLRLRYRLAGEGEEGNRRERSRAWQSGEPVRLAAGEAVEVGMVLSKPPAELRVAPYLSLNRGEFSVTLPRLDDENLVDDEPFIGIRPSEWRRPEDEMIVVDDLDNGFSVEQDTAQKGLRLGARAQDEVLDQGLPTVIGNQVPNEWSRRGVSDAWGKYRRTLAVVKKGKGQKRAVFTTDLPRAGTWRLELHMLPSRALRWKQGTYHLVVEDSSGSHELTFDAGAAEEGWNELGELEIASGEVRVALSDKTDGRAVTADAIRWNPASSNRVSSNRVAEGPGDG